MVATIPLASHTLIDAVLPLGWYAPFGNPTVGVHHVGRVSKRFWITGGGSLGIPLVEDNDFRVLTVPRALWHAHLHYENIVPIQAHVGIELHASIVEFRAKLEPSVWFPTGNNRDEKIAGAFYHAVELQLGHGIGAGLRLQGVAIGPGKDNYQFAMIPFFVVSRDLGFLRLGIMMPLDEELGPPFDRDAGGAGAWGWLVNTGLHID